MLVTQHLILPVFFSYVLFPKLSKSMKPEDCVIGKTYWSTSITETATCVKCPKYLRSCYDEAIGDQLHCVLSCSVKPTARRKPKASFTTTGTRTPLTPTPSLLVRYPSVVHPADGNEGRKSLGGKDVVSTKILVVICSLGVLVLFLFVALTVLIFKRRRISVKNRDTKHKKQMAQRSGGNEPGEQTPLTMSETQPSVVQGRNTAIQEADRPIVQASSSTPIGGIQDTEETNFSSALNLAEENHI